MLVAKPSAWCIDVAVARFEFSIDASWWRRRECLNPCLYLNFPTFFFSFIFIPFFPKLSSSFPSQIFDAWFCTSMKNTVQSALAIAFTYFSTTIAQQVCYWPYGTEANFTKDKLVNCSPDQDSQCCRKGDVCLSNGLCFGAACGRVGCVKLQSFRRF